MRIWQASQGQLPRHEFDRVLDELLYRLGAIKQGEDYARQLGLGFMPAGEFNDQVWLRDHPHLRTSRRFAWSEIVSRGSELFPSPPPNVDLAYYKLQAYLAAAFASAGRDEALISSPLEGLVEGIVRPEDWAWEPQEKAAGVLFRRQIAFQEIERNVGKFGKNRADVMKLLE
ncbi:MAG: hypothetical protein M1815_006139 [Lichina confinis]|nr:MAG: hypothetical protein M1815_006139 [Lichina confinis]